MECQLGHHNTYDEWTHCAADARNLFETDRGVFFSLSQRYGRQPWRCPRCARATRNRPRRPTTRRAGVFLQRLQTAGCPQRNGKLTPNRSPARSPSSARTSTTPNPSRSHPDPGHRSRQRTPWKKSAPSALPKELGLNLHYGRRTLRQCLCIPGLLTGRPDLKAGVDVLCFWRHQKRHGVVGSFILFFNHKLAEDLTTAANRQPVGSLSKLPPGPVGGPAENDAWLKHARHANHCAITAQQPSGRYSGGTPGSWYRPTAYSCNSELADAALDRQGLALLHLHRGRGGARFMCAWDTEEERAGIGRRYSGSNERLITNSASWYWPDCRDCFLILLTAT